MGRDAAGIGVEGWVLAGGRSRRMGRDKAGVVLAGKPMLEHMLGKLMSLGLRARVAGLRGKVEGIETEVVQDAHPDCGPLSGLETALRCSREPWALVVGVDLPLIPVDFLAWLMERAQLTGAMATVPRLLGEPQPLCAVYRRELLPAISEALESGDFKVLNAVERGMLRSSRDKIDFFDVERVAATDAWRAGWPVHWQWMNCNTPEDLARAEALL